MTEQDGTATWRRSAKELGGLIGIIMVAGIVLYALSGGFPSAGDGGELTAACQDELGPAWSADGYMQAAPPHIKCQNGDRTVWIEMPYEMADERGFNGTYYRDEW